MELLPVSFIAGVLTVLAPCILPMLPIIIGGSLSNGRNSVMRPVVVTVSLALSIVVFTLLLKATTALIYIPDTFWTWFSASIIIVFALTLLFPKEWFKLQSLIPKRLSIKSAANKSLASNTTDQSLVGAFFIGIALGPVFAACSPTFFIILGTVLPASFGVGLLNLVAYALGLALVLLLIVFLGQRVMSALSVAADPRGWFKKGMGVLFLFIGLAIVTGIDKDIETYFVQKGYGVTGIEQGLIKDYLKEDIMNKSIIEKDNTTRVNEISGTKLPIPDSEILAGGPPKDGIPPIDDPKFIANEQADWLNPSDEGVGVVDEAGMATFYPFRILVWHEIVNTQVVYKGQDNFPLAITYCPLCKTSIVFESMVSGVPTTFGTSGKLWQSNLLMYDRNVDETRESLWSQVLGTAVSGPATGVRLLIYPSTITTFAKWQGTYAETRVLSKETGHSRDYSTTPYTGYEESTEVYFPTNFSDTTTHPKTVVLGLDVGGNYIAFKKDNIKVGKTDVTFSGKFITIERTAGDTITFVDSNNKTLPYIEGFWFSWQAVHPSSILQ